MASPPFKVKAVYEYSSPHDDDLSFPTGQIITVTEEEDADWYVGEYTDNAGKKQEGLFPKNFVEKYEPAVPSRPVRAARPKQQESVPTPPPQAAHDEEDVAEEPLPPVPSASKPAPPPDEASPTATNSTEVPRSPQASTQPPPAPKPEPAEPAEPIKSEPAKKAPPPVAPKTSNLFKDRIAAFNQGGAAPIAPVQPGGKASQPSNFIKKPFVAPPPSKHAYIPPVQKQEPVHKPYVREEDPEIRQRQEEDRQAAEAAGLAGSERPSREGEGDDEEAPQPTSLKERIALLQKQQAEQAQRRAEGGPPKEKRPKPPPKQPSVTSQTQEDEEDGDLTRVPTTASAGRPSHDRQRSSMPAEPTSPRPSLPDHEILSDGHEADQSGAGETTDDAGTIGPEDSDEKPTPAKAARAPAAPPREPDVGDEEDTTEGDEGEEDSMDEETRRKEELRARMAKMSGGMGMGAMFNPFGAPPPAAPKKKKSTQDSSRSKQAAAAEENEAEQPSSQRMAMPVPGMAMPGMAPPPRVRSPESDLTPRGGEEDRELESPIAKQREDERAQDAEDFKPEPLPRRSTSGAAPPVPRERPAPQSPTQSRGVAPPVPGSRPVPAPPARAATESQATPRPPSANAPISPDAGSGSDDEIPAQQKRSSTDISRAETTSSRPSGAPPVPASRELPPQPPVSHPQSRNSYFGADAEARAAEQRSSRPPPPPPGQSAMMSPRPPPPPPPTQSMPSRTSTGLQSQDDDATERGESDYEGDYDTDIPATEKHKDAVKAIHARDSSLDDSTTADEGTPVRTPNPRAVPPPPPPGSNRVPPPVPSAPSSMDPDGVDYDPYRYDSNRAVPPTPSGPPAPPPREPELPRDDSSADDLYSGSPARQSMDRAPPQPPPQAPPQTRAVPPPPPPSTDRAAPPQPKQSLDVNRTMSTNRKSGDMGRTSMSNDYGQIAQDIDLSTSTQWWTAPQPLPPSLQSRNGVDILSESEESTTSKRGGKTTVSKEIYVLYMDYSQTVITVRYDPKDPTDTTLEQRHEPAPARPRQDQLESYWQRYGAKIAEEVHAHGHKKDPKLLGDGSPQALVRSLLQPFRDVLQPVGTRAYGALIYTNLGASVLQLDEIRPGDIVTLRNARFEGKHGLKQYKDDYGPQHVAVVDEWDGTKKKIRCWEQGRVKAKVREESFRLGDLRSGEVRVWRIVGREFVGWES